MVSSVRALQPENAYEPILVSVSGMVMLLRALHPLNALLPIDVTASGTTISLSAVQFSNVLLPMVRSVGESVTFCSCLQLLNTLFSRAVMVCGTAISVIAVPAKAFEPRVCSASERTVGANMLQVLNAYDPMYATFEMSKSASL